MSHELETINGQVAMAYAGELPWHGLGTAIPADLTPAQVLEAAHLDWKVVSRQLYFDRGGQRVKVGNKALVRDVDGKVLTVISKGWNPVQNDEAFQFFHDLVMAGRMEMHTAGSLCGGKKVWALAKINEAFDLRVNGRVTHDKVEGFLLLTNPHEYGKSLDARFTSVRVVCNNTHCLATSERGAGSVSLDHRRAFDPEKLQQMLGVAHLGMDTYKEQAQFLAAKRYTEEKLKEFFTDVFPHCNEQEKASGSLSAAAKKALDIVETQPGAEVAPGTYWNAFNAVTYLCDHVVGRNEDTRLTSSWYGYNRGRKDRAMAKALELAA